MFRHTIGNNYPENNTIRQRRHMSEKNEKVPSWNDKNEDFFAHYNFSPTHNSSSEESEKYWKTVSFAEDKNVSYPSISSNGVNSFSKVEPKFPPKTSSLQFTMQPRENSFAKAAPKSAIPAEKFLPKKTSSSLQFTMPPRENSSAMDSSSYDNSVMAQLIESNKVMQELLRANMEKQEQMEAKLEMLSYGVSQGSNERHYIRPRELPQSKKYFQESSSHELPTRTQTPVKSEEDDWEKWEEDIEETSSYSMLSSEKESYMKPNTTEYTSRGEKKPSVQKNSYNKEETKTVEKPMLNSDYYRMYRDAHREEFKQTQPLSGNPFFATATRHVGFFSKY